MKNGMQNERSYTKGGRVFSAFSTVIGTIGVVLVILLCIPVTVPGWFGYKIYNVVTGSMEPSVPVGSIVYTKQVEGEELSDGDIIAYGLNGMIITHRVMENHIEDKNLITKGDANSDVDMEKVRYSQVLGKVTLHLPFLGAFFEFFTSLKGKIILMCILVACFILLMLGSSKKKEKEI